MGRRKFVIIYNIDKATQTAKWRLRQNYDLSSNIEGFRRPCCHKIDVVLFFQTNEADDLPVFGSR